MADLPNRRTLFPSPASFRRALRPALLTLLASALCGVAVWLLAVGIGTGLAWHRDRQLTQPPEETNLGQPAPDFTLKDPAGRPFRLRDRVGQMPVVLELSSFT
jgi:hypothetical protein